MECMIAWERQGNMASFLLSALRVAVLVYAGMILVLAGCQRQMIYYPTRISEEEAIQLAATDQLEPWRNEDGEIIGWRSTRALADADVMLVFHGNAGFAGQRGYFAHGFAPDFIVYVMEYPGYGTRSGRPGEQAFYDAAEDAFQRLRKAYPEGRLFLTGESLGSGVAAYLAGRHPETVAGVFLSTPFDSMVAVARHHYPFFPVRWLMRDRYPTAKHLRDFAGPVAILLAGQDRVVPAKFGERLAAVYDGPSKLRVQEDRDHNTLDLSPGRPWWSEVVTFLRDPS